MDKGKVGFRLPMMKRERIAGYIYLPIHMFILPMLIDIVVPGIFYNLNIPLTDANINLAYYGVSFIFVLIGFFKYLRTSFSYIFDRPLRALTSAVFGLVLHYAMLAAISVAMAYFISDLVNPNTEAIINETKINTNSMTVIALLLAPIVEEVLFRGVLFGTIRLKSRALAYIVSAIAFALLHLWSNLVMDFEWIKLLYLLQYVPGAIVLAWCYERSNTIWSPIVLHMAINFISLMQTRAL